MRRPGNRKEYIGRTEEICKEEREKGNEKQTAGGGERMLKEGYGKDQWRALFGREQEKIAGADSTAGGQAWKKDRNMSRLTSCVLGDKS